LTSYSYQLLFIESLYLWFV